MGKSLLSDKNADGWAMCADSGQRTPQLRSLALKKNNGGGDT